MKVEAQVKAQVKAGLVKLAAKLVVKAVVQARMKILNSLITGITARPLSNQLPKNVLVQGQ
jgi:hypothetical protein